MNAINVIYIVLAASLYVAVAQDYQNMYWDDSEPDMPTKLSSVGGGIINDFLYLYGRSYNYEDERVWRYDLINFEWSEVTPRPFAGNHHCVITYQDKLWTFGGRYDFSGGKLQVYDPATDTWEIKAPFGWEVGAVACALIDDKMYIAGGEISGTEAIGRFTVYDPATDSYTDLEDMPVAVHHASGFVWEGEFWILAGRPTGPTAKFGTDLVQIYNPVTMEWRTSDSDASLTRFPYPATAMGASVEVCNKFFFFGGGAKKSAFTNEFDIFPHVNIYDPVADVWTKGPEMITPREAIHPLRYGNKIYVISSSPMMNWSFTGVNEVLYIDLDELCGAETVPEMEEESELEDTKEPMEEPTEEPTEVEEETTELVGFQDDVTTESPNLISDDPEALIASSAYSVLASAAIIMTVMCIVL